jgi:hypothetical protein
MAVVNLEDDGSRAAREEALGRRVRIIESERDSLVGAEGTVTLVHLTRGGDGRGHFAAVAVAVLGEDGQPREVEEFPLWALEPADGLGPLPPVDRPEVERLRRQFEAGDVLVGKWYLLADGREGKATKYRDGAGGTLELRMFFKDRPDRLEWVPYTAIRGASLGPDVRGAAAGRSGELEVLVGLRVEYESAGQGGDLRHEEFVGRRGTILEARYNSGGFRRPAGLPCTRGAVHIKVAFDADPDGERPDMMPWLWLDGCRPLQEGDEPERAALLAEARETAQSWIGERARVTSASPFNGRTGVVVEAEPSGNLVPGGLWSVALTLAFNIDRAGGPEIVFGFTADEVEGVPWPGQEDDSRPASEREEVGLLVAATRACSAWRERATSAERRLRLYEGAMGDLGRVFRRLREQVGAPATE